MHLVCTLLKRGSVNLCAFEHLLKYGKAEVDESSPVDIGGLHKIELIHDLFV